MRILSNVRYDDLLRASALVENLLFHMEQLKERIALLEKRVDAERERAERAIDAQLAVRGFPTVTPREGMPDIPDALEEDPEKVAEIEKRLRRGDATVFTEVR